MIRRFPIRSPKFLAAGLLSVAMTLCFVRLAHAQTGSKSYDCTDVRIDYQNDPSLTHEEKLSRMDEAFFASLNQYDACLSQQQSSSQSPSSSSASAASSSNQTNTENGSAEGSEDTSGSSQGTESLLGQGMGSMEQSVASSTMSGTEPQKPEAQAEDLPSEELMDTGAQSESSLDLSTGQNGSETGGQDSKTPEDIPPADNDDALAAQIRYAATQEKDPVKKKQLWNEYRKYKGMPTQ